MDAERKERDVRLDRKNWLLLALFPYATKQQRVAVRKLADGKNIDWLQKEISSILHDLMGSIIRHQATHYDECIAAVGKDKARFYVQGEVSRIMNRIKGVSV